MAFRVSKQSYETERREEEPKNDEMPYERPSLPDAHTVWFRLHHAWKSL